MSINIPSCMAIARTILDGFDKHYFIFRRFGNEAQFCFEHADWSRAGEGRKERILGYEERVTETVNALDRQFPDAGESSKMWPDVKTAYITLLLNHLQAECAETFYNSVVCRVLHRDYYSNDYIFWRPGVSTEHLHGSSPSYRSYYPPTRGLRRCLLLTVTGFGLDNTFQNLRRDIRRLETAILEHRHRDWKQHPNYQIQVLGSLFFRSKAAYIVCRIINGDHVQALVIPLIQDSDRHIYVDTALLRRKDVTIVFSFSRAYFMVDMEVPSAYVKFLISIMPGKSPVDLYAMLGLQKQAKTLFYREMLYHLSHSQDNFQIAPGVRGMVMLVFTLPSFQFVFKLIKDRFDPPKTSSREEVLQKYQLVKYHDRVGRLADTLEYSNVAISLDRIDPELLSELREKAAGSIEELGDNLVIKHIYIERRMEPLDQYLSQASPSRRRRAIRDFGQSIRDMVGTNIFPGDMLKKNFGVTRNERVVFYDYDEICYITDCNFRRIPPARSYEDEISDTPWYSIGQNDVFPESFAPFFFTNKKDLTEFRKYHEELLNPEWWKSMKDTILAGDLIDVFPYPVKRRFSVRFGKQ
ncbi:MAG: bifunctional isocitrate dehydrogenase kinase/phosphatase [Gammaproteobacteria bacterium]|nr:bifunctional isocitrate dehydrogenase kinase/phosphatase [Gammaproteobacteria bacterium]